MTDVQKAVVKTLLYFSLWKVGLEEDALWLSLISSKRIKHVDFKHALKSGIVKKRESLYFLKNKKYGKPADKNESIKKIIRAKKIAQKLSLIPSVLLIGVSGSVSHMSAKVEDDIDFFVVVENKTLWISRMLITIFLELLGVRRRRASHKVKNTICLNMIVERSGVVFSKQRQDIYTAYEIVRLVPLFERGNFYKEFLQKNRWVKDFLFNAFTIENRFEILSKKTSVPSGKFLSYFNGFAKVLQIWYMKPYRKKEIVSDTFLAFYPFDYRVHILREYDRKLKEYEFD